eukprot:m.39251 g.39251  ORF g.39251 m.39251 type:complete len:198 (+) comp32699_c0_seq1:510-1103(+)
MISVVTILVLAAALLGTVTRGNATSSSFGTTNVPISSSAIAVGLSTAASAHSLTTSSANSLPMTTTISTPLMRTSNRVSEIMSTAVIPNSTPVLPSSSVNATTGQPDTSASESRVLPSLSATTAVSVTPTGKRPTNVVDDGLTATDILPIVIGAAGGALILIGLLGLLFIHSARKQELTIRNGESSTTIKNQAFQGR